MDYVDWKFLPGQSGEGPEPVHNDVDVGGDLNSGALGFSVEWTVGAPWLGSVAGVCVLVGGEFAISGLDDGVRGVLPLPVSAG